MTQTNLSGPLELPGGILPRSATVISGDGAIAVPADDFSIVILTKGSAAAITIPAATAADEGKTIRVISGGGYAHVITQGTVGFNGKGSSGTATFATAAGNAVDLVAYNSIWWAAIKNCVTIA